jgi:hypothetical protein
MPVTDSAPPLTTPHTAELYRNALEMLNRSGVPYTVGGTYAFQYYAGISRSTKDFDIFVRPRDVQRVLDVLTRAGFRTEIAFTHWLAKAHHGDKFVDVIYSSGNGVAQVDDEWFAHAVDEEVLGVPVKLTPAEEMIWSKSLIMERERFDGADVAHIIRAVGDRLDWRRLLERYGKYWRALYAHIVLFTFVYPSDREQVPGWLIDELTERMRREQRNADEKVCYGTIISRQQYLKDVSDWGYEDARLADGRMSEEEIATWTAGIEVDGAK